MMGERDSQKQLWSFQVNLDKRVRSDHLLRRINQARDLDFVHPEVARFYSTKGKTGSEAASASDRTQLCRRSSWPSERELMRIIPERLDYMWFLGYGLDDTWFGRSSRYREDDAFPMWASRRDFDHLHATLVTGCTPPNDGPMSS